MQRTPPWIIAKGKMGKDDPLKPPCGWSTVGDLEGTSGQGAICSKQESAYACTENFFS